MLQDVFKFLQEVIKFRIPALLLPALLLRGQIGNDHPPNSRPVNLFYKLQLQAWENDIIRETYVNYIFISNSRTRPHRNHGTLGDARLLGWLQVDTR